MGVKGLTTYIANNAEQYLKPFELHDCLLVIDGDSLASNLYNWSPDCNSAFGGDYDTYHRIVIEFFQNLRLCNVRSFVLLDGGYQRRKLRTVQQRLRDKIAAIKHINPIEGHHLFPLMMREVFVEAVRSSPGVQVMRCLFEADDEVAMLARQLNCPVLSYDSDFYIHNVQYIPSVSLTTKVLKRTAPRRNRRKPAATSKAAQAAFRPYNYMDCCVYNITNLAGNQIRDEVLPLFGTLLGNDYINRVVFKKFFDNISTKNIGKRNTPQQKRIIALLRWLRGETLDSAIAKVLDRVEKSKRVWLAREIDQAMEGYVRADSEAFAYFGLTIDDVMEKAVGENICEDKPVEYEDDCSDIEDQIENASNDEVEVNCEDESIEQVNRSYRDADSSKNFDTPSWLLSRVLGAELPRYTIDLLSLRMYINSPQVENFQLPDSNDLALPILQLIFTLLHHPNPPPDQFQYLTRIQRASNVHFRSIAPVDPCSINFNPDDSLANLDIFRSLFANKPGVVEAAQSLNEQHQLFFLCLVYAGHHSKHLTASHFYSLIISLVVLNDATRLCPPLPKKLADFHKKFAKRLSDPTPNKDSDEALLLYHNVLPHFALNSRIRSKHTEFSSTTLHGFAELQAVMFQMTTLNSLLGKPFATMSPAHICNGSLWYNLAEALKPRADITHYVRVYVFAGCDGFFDMYSTFLEALRPFVSCLAGPREVTRKMTRNKRKKDKKKAIADKVSVEDVCEKIVGAGSESDGAFDDINNPFAALRISA